MDEAVSLIEKLKISDLVESNSIIQCLNSGVELSVNKLTASAKKEGLLRTYKVRLKNIHSKLGKHAKRLAISTDEFIKNLEHYDPAYLKTASISAQDVGEYLIWFIPDSYQVLGCMHLISQSDVSLEEFELMWNGT